MRSVLHFRQRDPPRSLSRGERRTAFNPQHWRFVLARDPELRKAIRAVTWMQPQIAEASLLVVLCADLKAWEKRPQCLKPRRPGRCPGPEILAPR